jgi:hypothetical protein
MFGLTQDQISGGARVILNTVATYLVAQGFLGEGAVEPFIAAGVGLVALAAALFFNRKSAQVVKTAALEGVTVVVSESKAPGTAAATVGTEGVKVTA